MIPKKKLGNSYNLTNNMSLPYINNSSKKFMLKSNFKKNLIDSSIKAQKYKLDVKRYTYNLNSKKKILDSLKKECERIKNMGKLNNKSIEGPIKFDSTEIQINSDEKDKMLNSNQERDNKVKSYKETKANLELSRYEYNTRNHENKKIKTELQTIDDEIKNIEYKIFERNNDIKNMKIKIEMAEKNIKEAKQLLDDGKEKNKKLNKIKELDLKRKTNLNILNETNKTIISNDKEINELRALLENLKKNK